MGTTEGAVVSPRVPKLFLKQMAETYNLDGSIPRAGDEGVLRCLVPEYRECLPLVLVIVHDRVRVDAYVEKLDGAIAACHEELVLVDLGPGQVVQRIVGVEAITAPIVYMSEASFPHTV